MKLGLGLKTELVCIEEILRRAASGHSSTNGMRMLCIGCLAHCAEIITTYWYRTPRPLKVGGRHGGSVAWNTSVDSSQIVWRLDVSDCMRSMRRESLRLSTHSFEKDSMPYRYRNRARLQASQRCIELLQLEFPPSATTRKSERVRESEHQSRLRQSTVGCLAMRSFGFIPILVTSERAVALEAAGVVEVDATEALCDDPDAKAPACR